MPAAAPLSCQSRMFLRSEVGSSALCSRRRSRAAGASRPHRPGPLLCSRPGGSRAEAYRPGRDGAGIDAGGGEVLSSPRYPQFRNFQVSGRGRAVYERRLQTTAFVSVVLFCLELASSSKGDQVLRCFGELGRLGCSQILYCFCGVRAQLKLAWLILGPKFECVASRVTLA